MWSGVSDGLKERVLDGVLDPHKGIGKFVWEIGQHLPC